MKFILKCMGVVSLALGTFGASAQLFKTEWTTIDTLLVHDTSFGGCMAKVASDFDTNSGGQCTKWVSFSCTHELLDQNQSDLMWESAQLAYALKKTIRIEADSNKKHNGHCVAKRIDFK